MAEKLEQGWVGRVSTRDGVMFVRAAASFFMGAQEGVWNVTPDAEKAAVFINEEDAKRATRECVVAVERMGMEVVALFPIRGDGKMRLRWSADEGWMSYDLHLEEA